MKISQFIKILENVKKEIGEDPNLCLSDKIDPVDSVVFDYEFGKVSMTLFSDGNESTTSILRKIDRKIVS